MWAKTVGDGCRGCAGGDDPTDPTDWSDVGFGVHILDNLLEVLEDDVAAQAELGSKLTISER